MTTPHRITFISTVIALAACSTGAVVPNGDEAPKLVAFSPSSLVPGTRLVLDGDKFRANEPMTLRFSGTVTDDAGGSPRRLEASLVPTIDSGTRLFADVTTDLLTAAGGDGQFTGTLTLEVTRGGQKLAVGLTAAFGLASELTPQLTGASTSAIFFGDHITLRGADLLLGGHDDIPEGGHEGELAVMATGSFLADDGTTDAISDYPLAVKATTRNEAIYIHTPEVFGLKTGEFRGTLTPINKHRGGHEVTGAPLPVSVLVLPSTIAAVTPSEASRQQRVKLGGHGFYSSHADGAVTVLHLKGQFTPTGGTHAALDVELPVRVETADQLTWVLSPTVVEEQLTGLGAKAGVFTGTITPVLQMGNDELAGEPWTGTFTVKPTKQIVVFKFTPQFTDALRLYGLRNVEEAVRNRLFEVARRDYGDFNLEFRAEKPDDFEQFTTMEITGDDPNDSDLFGLDNTDGKDVGNLRLNDYVGGTNAEQVESGAYAYGGVFLASFLRISPNVCRKNENGIWNYKACKDGSSFPLKTERFDGIFKAFAPILGGTEARADELNSGARMAALKEAVRVLGGLAGNTAVHELGHSLGLAQEIGIDEFHNPGDTPGWIMNPGSARPFEERAELDGQPPAVWAPGDREYLAATLGK